MKNCDSPSPPQRCLCVVSSQNTLTWFNKTVNVHAHFTLTQYSSIMPSVGEFVAPWFHRCTDQITMVNAENPFSHSLSHYDAKHYIQYHNLNCNLNGVQLMMPRESCERLRSEFRFCCRDTEHYCCPTVINTERNFNCHKI